MAQPGSSRNTEALLKRIIRAIQRMLKSQS